MYINQKILNSIYDCTKIPNVNKLYLIIMNKSQHLRPPQYLQRDENRMIELQKRLMEVWQQRNVEDYYQEIILNFLDKKTSNQLEYQIAKEIQTTHQGNSFYFKLNNQLNSRQKAINNLEKMITDSKYQNKNNIMPRICDEIKRLRDSNLGCAETIIQLNREYRQNSENLSAHQEQILRNLDQQNEFLKDSFLKNYIFFQNGYDPFFLYHYDLKGKRRPQSAHRDIDRLFNLNVSYACRLFKTKKQLMNIISTGRVNERFSTEIPSRDPTRRNSKIIANSEKSTNKYETINSDRETEKESRKTSVNFRGKSLSLQAAIQQDLLRNNKFLKDSSVSSKFRTRKLHTLAPQNLERSDPKVEKRFSPVQTPLIKHYNQHLQGDFEQKIIPPRNLSNAPSIIIPNQCNNLYKIVPIQSTIPKKNKKKKSAVDYYEPQQIIQSPNLKVKLQPINTNQLKNTQPTQPKRSSPIVLDKNKKSISPKRIYNSDEDQNQSEEQNINNQVKKQINRRRKKKKSNNFDVQPNHLLDTPQNKKKQLRMRPGKYSFSQLMKYLKGLRLKQEVKKNTIFSAKWEQSLSKFQSYFCQFIQNSQLLAVAICIKTAEGPYCIKLWGSIYNCDLQTSNLMFQKYIQYIQTHTKEQQLYFNGDYIKELKNCKFVQKRQNLFCRKRFFQGATTQADFQPFLSLKCSNIVFNQGKTTSNILYSQQIQSFSKKTTYISPTVALIQKRELSSQLSMLVKVNQELKDFKTLNRLLQDQCFDTYQQDLKIKISKIKALRCSINTSFKSSFITNEGSIRLSGFQLVKTQKQVLYKVPCVKNNIFVYFGKGFSDCSNFIHKSKRQGNKIFEFDVKMFNKELYGRLPVQSDEGCYGNWQINIWWQDELQGRVKHPNGSVQSLGPEPFYTGIQIEGELVYAFQVKKSDILL